MKKTLFLKKTVALVLSLVIIFGTLGNSAFAVDTFEQSISVFPESYKVKLRSLHKLHPNWRFEALKTNLDWNDAVEAENKANKSLVINASGYTDIFKSREVGDYDASKNTYIQKDAGFVRANKLAVSFYMDPRNFLNERSIFQFEKLSFDKTITVKEVEDILDGSFMSNKKIVYLDSKGNKVSTNELYSEVIYAAGKTYNVNPCFLASRIINEVGSNGSKSVSGDHKTYPGIYNFYNVGAYDGADPISTGLKWAASGTSYERPWNTPKKAIMGGAKYNAEKYIAAGQHTGYLQRFNVNPGSSYTVYTHQYMTNLAGIVTPANDTYKSYAANNILEKNFIFSIPVFNNMPAEKKSSGTIKTADGQIQNATVTMNCNVRTGPSTEYQTLGFVLPNATSVKIIETVFTDSKNINVKNKTPFWSKIEFTYSSKKYTGYVCSDYLSLTTQTVVKVGTYSPLVFKTNSDLSFNYISSDPKTAVIENNKTVKFLKTGTVEITAYDSLMNYHKVKYLVVDSEKYKMNSIKSKEVTSSSVTVSFDKNSNFSEYECYISDSSGKFIKSVKATASPVIITGLKENSNYKICVRGKISSKNYSSFSNVLSFKTAAQLIIETPKDLKAKNSELSSVLLTWSKSSGVDGYCLYTYDDATKTYKLLKDVGNVSSYSDKSSNAVKKVKYAIRAYTDTGSGKKYLSYSPLVSYTPPTIKVGNVTDLTSSAKNNQIQLKWKKVNYATSYQVYIYSDSSKKYIRHSTVKSNSALITSLSSAKLHKFKVRAVISLYGKNYYGAYQSINTYTLPNEVKSIKQSSVTNTSYTLSWDKVSGATGYRVYKYDAKTKSYSKVKTLTSNSLKIKNLSPGQKTTYVIKSYLKKDGVTVWSKISKNFIASSKPSALKSLKSGNITKKSFVLSWTEVDKADGYAVYMLNSKTKKYEKLLTTKRVSVLVEDLKSKTSYSFYVRPYTKTSNVTVYADKSKILSVKTR